VGARYREMEIRTASPEMLIVKLYEGAVRFIRVARESHHKGRLQERGNAISRALAIVAELQQSLNMEVGGDITKNLDALYLFVTDRLLEANVKGRVEALDEAQSVLQELNVAWVEIAKNPPSPEALAVGTAGTPS
jgi:flagellar protein FliS